MTRSAVFIALGLAISPTALWAEGAEPFATYGVYSGTVAPEYAWSITLLIEADGSVTRSDCKGYETEGPACVVTSGQTTPEALEAIRAAVVQSGLIETPARPTEMPSIGGGSIQGAVVIDGQRAALISQPDESDKHRVQTVLTAIRAAIPAEMQAELDGQ